MPVAKKKPVKMFGYKTYSFSDKDPIIDILRTIIEEQGLKWKDIAADAGISETTLGAWFYGLTKRPQFATVKAVCAVCGYDREPRKPTQVMRLVRRRS